MSVVLAMAVGIGCDDEEPAAPDPAPSEPESEPEERTAADDVPEPSPIGEVMRGHFTKAVSARDALIRADVEQARADMEWLATHDGGDEIPEPLRPRFAAMQQEAARFAEAETLTEAGTAFGHTLVRCGECHAAAGSGPEIAEAPIPDGDGTAAHMRRHRWASERMWAGLITASPETFRQGTDALVDVPLHAHQVPDSDEAPPETIEQLTDHVHELGQDALDADDDTDRAAIYGRYLATCGTCHRLVGVSPE